MADTPKDWRETRIVESFDVDLRGRLRPQVLFSYLLNAAWGHTRATSYGHQELSARNLMWVLIKFTLIIKSQPRWHDELRIESWGKGIKRLYALRDFRVTAPSGEILVSATSSWLILEKSSGRPQRFDPNSDGFPWQPEKNELETNLERLAEPQGGKPIARFKVLFSDIDVNNHVGSAKYLQWLLDAHSGEKLTAQAPEEIEISYLSEAMLGDDVVVLSVERGDKEFCSIRREAGDEKELCRAQIIWKQMK